MLDVNILATVVLCGIAIVTIMFGIATAIHCNRR